MSRRLAREKAMQVLFQIDVGKIEPEIALKSVFEETRMNSEAKKFAKDLVFGVLEHIETLNQYIQDFAINWELKRIANVDRSLLRLAIYEMLFLSEQIPPNVSINEAVELAKKFSTIEGSKFINGILDKIKKHLTEQGKIGEPHD